MISGKSIPSLAPALPKQAPWIITFSFALLGILGGCSDDSDLVREIQAKRQERQQAQNKQDHLGDVFVLLREYISLEPEKAQRQIAFHLNQWSNSRKQTDATAPALSKSLRDLVQLEPFIREVEDPVFQPLDAQHLRDCYLFHSLYEWIDTDFHDDLLLKDWMEAKKGDLSAEQLRQLRTASRLFDWTVRNIVLEPAVDNSLDASPNPVKHPSLPFGIQVGGTGYRQTVYQTLMRGTGDGLQRANVFTQLCSQANIPAAVLATIDSTTGDTEPFCVGVLIGDEIYLYEPTLGIHVPGPNQYGIATLSQARRDAVLMRRLSIAGLEKFTYAVSRDDVQQCAALLNLPPAMYSPRMKQLQLGLTGDRRMNVYTDADAIAADFDAVTGIGSVRLWKIPMLAEAYRAACELHAERDPLFAYWYKWRWAMMDEQFDMAENLRLGRWRHLLGQFDDDEVEDIAGARSLYLEVRKPEFEIEDLRIDVDLQTEYGIRRELGMDSSTYDRQVFEIQKLMMQGKRTATYWLSLVQADDGRLDTAENWIDKRVLAENQMSYWVIHAQYNLARLKELQGQVDEAIDIYKMENAVQEHGNRIRARLLAKSQDDS